MPDTMIERMALAAKAALIADPDTDAWMRADDAPEDFQIDGTVNLKHTMRAVLAAMREPTEAMAEAGGNRDTLGWDAAPGAVYRAMIDAALAEEV